MADNRTHTHTHTNTANGSSSFVYNDAMIS